MPDRPLHCLGLAVDLLLRLRLCSADRCKSSAESGVSTRIALLPVKPVKIADVGEERHQEPVDLEVPKARREGAASLGAFRHLFRRVQE